MNKFSCLLLLVVMTVMPTGCSRKTPTPKAKSATTAHSAHNHVDPNDRAIQEDERAIEQRALAAKRKIDAEADAALKKARESAKARGNRHVQELSEFAAEMSEEAKDRAEDIPEEVDRPAIQRQADRRSPSRSKHMPVNSVEENLDSDASKDLDE